MKVAIYSLSKSGHNAIVNWILKSLDPNLDYAVCYYDVLNPTNTYYVSKDRLGITQDEFFKYENTFMVMEDFDFTKQYIEADIQVIIMRDYPNFWASLHKFIKDNPMHRDMLRINYGELWMKYYEEFIGRTRIFDKVVTISYNEWFQFESYREAVLSEAHRFGIPCVTLPVGLGTVTKQGYGSSFDGFEHQHAPHKMAVLTRYRLLMKDQEYVENLLDNQKNILASQRTFRIKNPFEDKPSSTPLDNFTEEHFQSWFD